MNRWFCRHVTTLAMLLSIALLSGVTAAHATARDPLLPILHGMNRYFHRHEVDGAVVDARVILNESEAIRLSVISQLLGYEELYRVYRVRAFRVDIAERADYLLRHYDSILSHGPFDGMLGLALLQAYEVTGDPRHLEKGVEIVRELEALPRYDRILNGGLMAALALAKYWRMTGDPVAEAVVRDVLVLLPPYQNPDGSFPHWCPGSEDVHYTGWMTMELILLQRLIDDPAIDPMLHRMLGFMEARVDPDGRTSYEEPCPDYPGCVRSYYSIATGCGIDYDTRAFTNELGYTALLFDRFDSPEYGPVMRFMRGLENRGTFPDKWDFWPPPSDPYYPWTIADTSVVNMSVMFWSLGSIVSGRRVRERDHDLETRVFEEDDETLAPDAAAEPRTMRFQAVVPRPMRGSCELRFELPAAAGVSLAIYDAAGRVVRELPAGLLGAGPHTVRWDRRDSRGLRSAK